MSQRFQRSESAATEAEYYKRKYRVAHHPRCAGADWYCKSFYSLDVEKIETIDTRLRAQAARTFRPNPPGSPSPTLTSLDPAHMADYSIYLGGGANVDLWTTDMVSTLAALPTTGGSRTRPPATGDLAEPSRLHRATRHPRRSITELLQSPGARLCSLNTANPLR